MSAFTSQALLAALTAPVQRVLKDVEQVLGLEVESKEQQAREAAEPTREQGRVGPPMEVGRGGNAVPGGDTSRAPVSSSVPRASRAEVERRDVGPGAAEPSLPRLVPRRESPGAVRPVAKARGLESGALASSPAPSAATASAPPVRTGATPSSMREGAVPEAFAASLPPSPAPEAAAGMEPASSERREPTREVLPRLVLRREPAAAARSRSREEGAALAAPGPGAPRSVTEEGTLAAEVPAAPRTVKPPASVREGPAASPEVGALPTLFLPSPAREATSPARVEASVPDAAVLASPAPVPSRAPVSSGLPLVPRSVPPPLASVEPSLAVRTGLAQVGEPTVSPSTVRSAQAPGLALATQVSSALHPYRVPELQPVSPPRPMAALAPPPAAPPERALLPLEPPTPPSQAEALAFDRERLTEALVDILQDAARREGLEV